MKKKREKSDLVNRSTGGASLDCCDSIQDFNVEALEKFVEESSVPVVTLFNKDPSNHPFVIKFFNSPNAKAMLFANLSGDGIDSLKSKFREVAEQYKGQGIGFLLGDLEASQAAFQYFGVQESQVPVIIIQNNDGKKYLKPNLKADDIAPFVKDYKEGNVPPYVKSEPVPEENNEPVKVVVVDTLEDMVFKSGKNVLLEFYAPWCGHCKKLAPILDEVAVHFEKDASVLIAKLDATANDIVDESFDVRALKRELDLQFYTGTAIGLDDAGSSSLTSFPFSSMNLF
ncbi:hypothetical protein V6N12_003438 [Hibiscus sabdariffa]|uniref:protein disulfide-isomerase n=1 Tax=Hibiscus sabdariffa TaxID=183260 RepID=A0ABR2AR69_9ROSI